MAQIVIKTKACSGFGPNIRNIEINILPLYFCMLLLLLRFLLPFYFLQSFPRSV
jgi:hypothetical protein